MTLQEIQKAVTDGKRVHWASPAYTVILDSLGQWFIRCHNGNCIGLTWADGKTLNGKESQFYVLADRQSQSIADAQQSARECLTELETK